MKKEGYYSSGQFAKMAGVSVRTIRYYDKQEVLKPSFLTESGARFYTDQDFVRLQQILLLKYLGFSLEDIKEMVIGDTDYHFLLNALKMQKKLVQDRIEQMQMVAMAITDTTEEIEKKKVVDWSQMLHLIHLTGMEKSVKSQYQNATNISARIELHKKYSVNKQGWFPWVYENCQIADGMKILELGCGNGDLWLENIKRIPENCEIVLTDGSAGMVRDVRRTLEKKGRQFRFSKMNCEKISYEAESFDLVIANHLLFYCDDIDQVCEEVVRVLKPGGMFVCSTYGKHHMQEISKLVTKFDSHILLSAEKLYDKFGLENGKEILEPYFSSVIMKQYEDGIEITDPEPLIEYILSCHGNQKEYILNHYQKFRQFVERQVKNTFHITKEAGIFISKK